MRILDRYILKSVLGIFLGCLFTFFFLYIIIDILSHLDMILENNVAIEALWSYYMGYLPIIFVQVSPIACLLATLYTFAKLNRDNEIIVMRSSGLSILQITKNVMVFGFIVSLFVFWANDKLVPASQSYTQNMKDEFERESSPQKRNEAIENLSMYGTNNRLFFVNKFYPSRNTLEGIVILEHNQKQDIIRKVVANKGVYKDGVWRFYGSITYEFDPNGQIKDEPQFTEEEIMTITDTPKDFLTQRQRPEYMNIAQLDKYIWRLSRSGASTVIRNLKVDLYQRFSFPFTSLLMIFMAIPFSMKMRKRATGISSLGVSIMVGFLYYVLNAVSVALGKAGVLIPALSATLSHIVILSLSLYLTKSLP